MSESKKHHFVPQELLRGFSCGGKREQICTFDRWRGTARTGSIKDTGCENRFNTVTVGGQTLNFEKLFNDCDGQLARLLTRLHETRALSSLSPEDYLILARVLVVQMSRTRLARAVLRSMDEQLRDIVVKFGGQRPEVNDEEREASERLHAVRGLRDTAKQSLALLGKDWILCETSTDLPFWISDHPVVWHNEFPGGTVGLQAPGVQIAFPLGAELMLWILCPSVARRFELDGQPNAELLRLRPTFKVRPEFVDYYNRRQVGDAFRFAYAPTEDFAVARELLQKHPEMRGEQQRVTIDGGLCSSLRDLPDGSWLLVVGAQTYHTVPVERWHEHEGGVRATITKDGMTALAHLLADGPYKQAEVQTKGGAAKVMSGVAMREVEGLPGTVDIYHASEGLRKLMRQISKRRSAGGDAGGGAGARADGDSPAG